MKPETLARPSRIFRFRMHCDRDFCTQQNLHFSTYRPILPKPLIPTLIDMVIFAQFNFDKVNEGSK